MNAPRKRAAEVQVGDLILNVHAPRTWRPVTQVLSDPIDPERVGFDTATDRTWWFADDLVPCRSVDVAGVPG